MPTSTEEYLISVGAIALSTIACFILHLAVSPTDLAMVYLAGIVVVALRGHRGPSLLACLLSVLAFDFFFVPPRYTFHVEHQQYFVTFTVMFGAGLLISHLALRVKIQGMQAQKSAVVAETEKLRSSLLSAVSHELRTPLTAIIGSADAVMQMSPKNISECTGLITNIRTEAERMMRLVHNLIETTRLESGISLKKQPHAIEDVLGTALDHAESIVSGVEINIDVPDNLPLVPIDPILMELVFVNLLENVARHAPGSPLDINVRERINTLEISFTDKGPGLKGDDVIRVFDKFYRADTTKGGAGLGLAICKAVAEAHGGSIRAENRNGGGARFLLSLPTV